MSLMEPLRQVPRLGDDRLDDDHEEIRSLAQAFRVADASGRLQAFDALHAQVLEHFATEDALMAPHDFSSKECHVDEHAAVRQSFAEVRVAIEAGRADVASRFADHFLFWLPEHADALDRQLAKLLFYRKTGGAAVMLRRQMP
jgi:hemerythrin